MRSILTCGFSVQLILEFCYQFWKCSILIHVLTSSLSTFTMVSNKTYLNMSVSNGCLLHFCHPGITVQILFSRSILFFAVVGLCPRMCWHRIAAAAAAAAAFSRRPGLPVSWTQRFPDARLKIQSSFQRCSNLVSLARDLPGQVWKIRNTHNWGFLPSCATRNRDS